MRKIHVGIAYEGSADIDALKIIIKRVLNLQGLDFDPDAVYPQTPGSGIIGFVPVYAKRFTNSGVALPIYCTDQDKDKKSRRDVIIGKLRDTVPEMLEVSVVGVSIPHFEAWLVADEDVVKNIIGLAGDKPLPSDNLQPKDRLISLYQNHYDGNLSLSDIRSLLASNMDISKVERIKHDFGQFVDDIRRAASSIKSQ